MPYLGVPVYNGSSIRGPSMHECGLCDLLVLTGSDGGLRMSCSTALEDFASSVCTFVPFRITILENGIAQSSDVGTVLCIIGPIDATLRMERNFYVGCRRGR